MRLLTLVIVLIIEGRAQIVSEEECPSVKAMPIEQLHRLTGIWYETKIIRNDFDEEFSCVTHNVTAVAGSRLDGTYTAKIRVGWFNEEVTLANVMLLEEQSKEADFKVELCVGYKNKVGTNVKILSTPIADCLVYWICEDALEGGSVRYAWLESRNRSLTDDQFGVIRDYFQEAKLGGIQLINRNQDYCNNDV